MRYKIDKNNRIKSVINRSNLNEEQVKERMNFQVDYDKKDFSNYIVIKNDKEKIDLINQVLNIANKIDN